MLIKLHLKLNARSSSSCSCSGEPSSQAIASATEQMQLQNILKGQAMRRYRRAPSLCEFGQARQGSSGIHCPLKRTSRSLRATSSANSASVRSESPMAIRQSKSMSESSPNSELPEPPIRQRLRLTLARSRGFFRLAASHQAGSSTCQPASSKRWLSTVKNRQAASSVSGLPRTSSLLPANRSAGKACAQAIQPAGRALMHIG